MRLYEFLKVMSKETFISLSVSVCGMQFVTRHSVEFYNDNGDELNSKKIEKVFMVDGELHIRLED